MSLILNVSTNYVRSYFVSHTTDKIAIVPQFSRPKLFSQLWKLPEYFTRRNTFHYLHYPSRRVSGRRLDKYVNMVFHYFHRVYYELILFGNLVEYSFCIIRYFLTEYISSVFRYPDQMIFQFVNGMFSPSYPHAVVILNLTSLCKSLPLNYRRPHFHPASKLTGIQWVFL
jgi:hypothetical protein